MNEQLQQKLIELADKLGVAVEHLYGVIMWQMQLEGLLGLSLTVMIFVVFVALFFGTKRLSKKLDEIDNGMAGLLIPIWLVVVVCTIFSFFALKDNITKIFNPEFAALNYILGMLN